MHALRALGHALELTASMTWEILWALILGFLLAAGVQALVRRERVAGMLGDDRPTTLAVAAGLGAASSSCSYAAVALARTLFRKGAHFTTAMAFEIASTNLVVELGIILAVLLGWQFTAAEFTGGPLMIALLALAYRRLLTTKLVDAARRQAETGLAGAMEGHAAMDMSIRADGSPWHRLRSSEGSTAVSHIFVMEWAAVLRDIIIGLLIAGAVAAWVPDSFWQQLFFTGHPLAAKIWGPLIGPVVAVATFVCSIGNVPLAAVLWHGGISFGGVVAFIFADLIIIPILVIYRKYYGRRMMLFILATFYATMVAAAYGVELIYGGLGITPTDRSVQTAMQPSFAWNYTTYLNLVLLAVSAVLLVRFFRTGGVAMLRMMDGSREEHDDAHSCHGTHQPAPELAAATSAGLSHDHARPQGATP